MEEESKICFCSMKNNTFVVQRQVKTFKESLTGGVQQADVAPLNLQGREDDTFRMVDDSFLLIDVIRGSGSTNTCSPT